MISVRDTFFQIVEKTNTYLQKDGLVVYPKCANIVEISQLLTKQDETAQEREQKYPGIFLLKDYAEDFTNMWQEQITTRVQILIVADSKPDYTTDDREEKVIKPILYPICEAFLKAASRYIDISLTAGFKKIDRGFISNALNEAMAQAKLRNLFNDFLDGVELRDLPLLINKTC